MINNKAINFGCNEFKQLESVILHRPTLKALSLINEDNYKRYLFDNVPNIQLFIEEHINYQKVLESCGVKVYLLNDYVRENQGLIDKMPNLHYTHDIAVITKHGAILSKMAYDGFNWVGRGGEEIVIKEALYNLNIPIFFEFDEKDDWFEGCLLISHDTILIAHTERHKFKSIKKFITFASKKYSEIIYVDIPKDRRFMHPDTVFNRVHNNIAVAYPPAFQKAILFNNGNKREIDFLEYIKNKGVEIIEVSDSEQKRLACSFVPIKPGVILHYDSAFNESTKTLLMQKGVKLIPFSPNALLVGGGSLRCLTLRVCRK